MGHAQDVERIGPDELVEIEGPPEIHRRQAFAKPGLWAGLTTTEPGLVSGWHHHGGHDTIVYLISGSVAIEFGEGGRQAVQAGAGDFLVIPAASSTGKAPPSATPPRASLSEPAETARRRSRSTAPPRDLSNIGEGPMNCVASSI